LAQAAASSRALPHEQFLNIFAWEHFATMVYQEIKDTVLSKVAGSCFERLFYRFVCFIATVAFLLAVVNVALKAQNMLTEVTIETVEAFPWPVMFFCYKSTEFSALDFDVQMDTPACSGSGADVVVNTLDLGGGAPLKADCLKFTESHQDNNLANPNTATKAYELSQRWEAFSREFNRDASNPNGDNNDDWMCSTLNEDGKLASTPDLFTFVDFKWTTRLSQAQAEHNGHHVFSGILDPSLSFADQTKNGLTVFEVGMVNTKAQITFTVDKIVTQDISSIFTSSKLGAKVEKMNNVAAVESVSELLKDDTVQLKYHPGVTIQSFQPITRADSQKQESELRFQPLNYVSRVVTKRYKTWDEIWAEIGGTWATALLLVTAFYTQKTVENPKKKGEDAAPLEQVQVFRLRGVSSKEQAVKTMYAMAGDAYGAAKENQAQAEPEAAA